ncbi:MAG: arginase family protein [Bacteroidales bacterium]|jgi:arginase family enzyme|nr:arginase family protein [Bacteroidales bacterium]
MNLKDYLIPVSDDIVPPGKGKLGHNIIMYQSDAGLTIPASAKIAILGVPEDRFSNCAGEIKLPEQTRRQLYALSEGTPETIIDLGNLRIGKTLSDTYFGLQHVLTELASLQIVTLVIGGTFDLFYGSFLAFESEKPTITTVTPYLRLPDYGNHHPLNTIIYHSDNFPVNFCNIGYQSYYNSREDLDYLKDQFFETYRLGEATADITKCEPVLRDTDLLALSLSAVKYADAPAASFPSPNGFTGEETCQLAYYAGLGYRCKSMSIFDALLQNDVQNITAKLAAQIAWYFIEGVKRRSMEHPKTAPQKFKKYLIFYDQLHYNLCFYKHIQTERWWLEVPSLKGKTEYISCTYDDYTKATEQEIPERWWKRYQKIN